MKYTEHPNMLVQFPREIINSCPRGNVFPFFSFTPQLLYLTCKNYLTSCFIAVIDYYHRYQALCLSGNFFPCSTFYSPFVIPAMTKTLSLKHIK